MFFKKKDYEVVAFTTGKTLELGMTHDPMFAAKLVGDGIAIESVDGKFYSPVNGTVVTVFPTKHALGIKTKEGYEFLLHIGIDTVSLNGEGFTSYVSANQKVSKGDLLLEADLDLIRSKGLYSEAILCLCEPKNLSLELTQDALVEANKSVVMKVRK